MIRVFKTIVGISLATIFLSGLLTIKSEADRLKTEPAIQMAHEKSQLITEANTEEQNAWPRSTMESFKEAALEVFKIPDAQDPAAENESPELDSATETPQHVDEWELEMMACLIYIEAGGDACSDETRLGVGNVALNRVADDRFPDDLESVLLQDGQYNTFSWTGIVWPERSKTDVEQHAVDRAYDCARRLLEGERVFDETVVWQSGVPQGVEVVAYQDGIYFCR